MRIPIRKLASEVGRHPNKFHEWVRKHGFEIIKEKLPSSEHRGVPVSTVSEEDANTIREMIIDLNSSQTSTHRSKLGGYFYIIQLEPDKDPNRIKLGFANDVQLRLRKHQCSAPYAKIIKTWECKSLWEKTIIDIATLSEKKLNESKIDTECFDVESISATTDRIDIFFKLTQT
ncbi:MAG: hypothetical protein FWC98_02995 [Bacteroidales bacterium]|nr:hypothetical protein [Bacteroidales bacterium]